MPRPLPLFAFLPIALATPAGATAWLWPAPHASVELGAAAVRGGSQVTSSGRFS